MYKLFIILMCLSSFCYSGDYTANDARKDTKQAIINTKKKTMAVYKKLCLRKIKTAAKNGSYKTKCEFIHKETYIDLKNYLTNLGYNVTYKKGIYKEIIISWEN